MLDHYSGGPWMPTSYPLGDRMLDAAAELVGLVFCDSLEVYDATEPRRCLVEPERRRGYPLMPALYPARCRRAGRRRRTR